MPVQEALEIVHGKLSAHESLGERTAHMADQVTHLFNHCLRITYVPFQGEYYQQKDSVTIEFPVSPVVANICKDMFEDLMLSTTQASRV